MAGGIAYLLTQDGAWREEEFSNFPKELTKFKGRNYDLISHSTKETSAFYKEISRGVDKKPMSVQLTIENLQNDLIRAEKDKALLIDQANQIKHSAGDTIKQQRHNILMLVGILAGRWEDGVV